MPGEGGARSQGLISSHHGLAVKGVTFPSAGCPRWKRLPWTGNRLGACLPGRLGRVGGLVHLPGLLGWARLSSRLQGPGRAVLTHLHPGLLHDQLHDLPHGLHLRPFQDHRGPPHRHVGPRGTGPGLGKGTLGRGAVCREPQLRQRRSWQGAAAQAEAQFAGSRSSGSWAPLLQQCRQEHTWVLTPVSAFPVPLAPSSLYPPASLLHVTLGRWSC